MSEEKKGSLTGVRRRVRFGLILLTCCCLIFAAALSVVYADRDLLREFAENRIRLLLEQDAGLEFHLDGSRLRLVPLQIVLEGITLRSQSEPWVLFAERAEMSITLYSIIFQHAGIARVRLIGPRYRQWTPPGDSEEPGEEPVARRGGMAFDPRALLTVGLPFRGLEVIDGEVQMALGDGESLELGGVHLSAFLSGGRLLGSAGFRRGSLRHDGKEWPLGELSAELVVGEEMVDIQKIDMRSPLLEGRVTGKVDYLGAATLRGSVKGRIGKITQRLGWGKPLDGHLSFEGEASGSLFDPRLSGRVSLTRPVVLEERWPGLTGMVAYKDRKLEVRDFRAAIGRGRIGGNGTLDLTGRRPAYRIEVTAKDVEPVDLPAAAATPAADLTILEGRLAWAGRGFGREDITGSGLVEAGFLVDGWKPGEIELRSEVVLQGPLLGVSNLELQSSGLLVRARGAYRVGEDLSIRVEGGAGDLADLAKHWGIEEVGGRLTLEGEVASTPAGITFEGPVRLEDGRAYNLEGFDFVANVGAGLKEASLSQGILNWRGTRIMTDGTVRFPGRQIDFLTTWENLAAADAADLIGLETDLEGMISVQGRLLGPWEGPTLAGRFQAASLRYGDILVEEAGGNVTYADGLLNLADSTLRSGSSTLTFSGGLVGGRLLSGAFESAGFDLKSFLPSTAANVTGQIDGRLGGTVDSPLLTGSFRADDLNYKAWSFKSGEGVFEYSDGAFTIDGHLAEKVNQFQIFVEPRGEWPFEMSIDLGRFSPELARDGFLALPAKVRDSMKDLSFLAVGKFNAGGNLREIESIVARLDVETISVYTEGQTLRNATPIQLVWRERKVEIGKFTLDGEDYRIAVEGSGGQEAGWDLRLDGEINLSVFRRYWGDELEQIDAPGQVRFHIFGPWESPEVGGTVRFLGGMVKAGSIPEPVYDISGEGELKGRSFILSDFSGRMGDGAFIAGGTYDFDSQEVDAFVEGRLDLAIFKPRVPGAREMHGPIEARLSVKGPSSRPEFIGEAHMKGAEIFLQSMPERITELTGSVFLEEGRIELRDLAGKMGRGEVRLEGALDWRESPARVDFFLEGRRVLLVVEGTAKALLNTDLELAGDVENMKLSGTIDLVKARYFREFGDKDAKEKLKELSVKLQDDKKKKGPYTENIEGLTLNVQINAPDRFWISNKMAELENSVSLHVGGTVKEPELHGEVRLLRGEVTYFSRRFTLYSGRIFNNPPGINPAVEAQAEVVVGDTRIYLLLDGPLRKPKLHLNSVPPLYQEDLIALLTVGHTRSGLEEQEEEALAIGAAIVLGTPIIEQVGEEAREIAGIETFQVEPYLGEDGAGGRVTVGTKLSDRLYMSASQSIGVTAEDQQVRLEYQLIDYLSVLGRQLQQGIYSFDLVFRYDFD